MSAETDALLGKDFDERRVEPDLHQRQFTTKFRIRTWNVAPLYRCGNLENDQEERKRLNVNI